MFLDVKRMIGFNVVAEDGEFGKVEDILIDDQTWEMRYLVVDTGSWLSGRSVLVSSTAVRRPDWSGQFIPVSLTKQQIEASPPLEKDKPVTRDFEEVIHMHFDWEPYWVRGPLEGTRKVEQEEAEEEEEREEEEARRAESATDEPNRHLRRVNEILGYHIHASDGDIGHIDDFIVDDEGWILRYAIVDTHNWLPDRKVLIAMSWLEDIHEDTSKIDVDLTREQVKNSPEWDTKTTLRRPYEELLFDHYKREKYWL